MTTNVLFDVILPSSHSALPKLHTHLRRSAIHSKRCQVGYSIGVLLVLLWSIPPCLESGCLRLRRVESSPAVLRLLHEYTPLALAGWHGLLSRWRREAHVSLSSLWGAWRVWRLRNLVVRVCRDRVLQRWW